MARRTIARVSLYYLRELSLPNFYFHVTTAYALLRMAGVPLGKRDYLGSVTLHPVKD